MARRVARRRRGARRDNPRGYIRYRGRWIASAPYFSHGRVVSRKRRARRYDDNPRRRRRGRRRNPSGFIRVRRRWQPIPRYARRGRKGRFRSFRFPKAYTRRRVRRNPPRRSRRLRRYSNPRFYGRRRRMTRLLNNPLDAIKSAIEEAFSGETLETVFHTGLGFGGTAVVSRLLYKKVIPAIGESAIGRVATTIGSGILGSGLVGMLTGDPVMATRFLAGGMITSFWQVLSEVLPAEAKEFIPTLGEAPESAEFRAAIEREVLKEIRGGGAQAGAEGMSVYLRPAGVQEFFIKPAGQEAYMTQGEGDRAGVSGFLTQREMEGASAGVGEAYDEFSAKAMPERF